MDAQHERGYQLDDCRRRMHQPLCQVRCLPLPVSLRTPSRLQLVPPMPQAAPRCARFSIRPRQAPLTPTLTHPHPHPNPHPSPLATHPSPSPLTSHLSPLTSHPRRIPSPSPHDLTTHLFRLCHSPHRQAAAARPSCLVGCRHRAASKRIGSEQPSRPKSDESDESDTRATRRRRDILHPYC